MNFFQLYVYLYCLEYLWKIKYNSNYTFLHLCKPLNMLRYFKHNFSLYSIWGTVLCKGWWLKNLRERTFLIEEGEDKTFLYSCSADIHTCLTDRFKPLKCIKVWSHNHNVDEIVLPENILSRKCKLNDWEATTPLSLPNRRWKSH